MDREKFVEKMETAVPISREYTGHKMAEIQLRSCPFCGCSVSWANDYGMRAEHEAECYFYYIDHQNSFRFHENENHRNALLAAWNRRNNGHE